MKRKLARLSLFVFVISMAVSGEVFALTPPPSACETDSRIISLEKKIALTKKQLASVQKKIDYLTKDYFSHQEKITESDTALKKVREELKDCKLITSSASGVKESPKCKKLRNLERKLVERISEEVDSMKRVQAVIYRHGNRRSAFEIDLKKDGVRLIIVKRELGCPMPWPGTVVPKY